MRKLTSRKFWLGIIGALAPYVVRAAGGDIDTRTAVALSTGALIAYVLAEAGVDIAAVRRV